MKYRMKNIRLNIGKWLLLLGGGNFAGRRPDPGLPSRRFRGGPGQSRLQPERQREEYRYHRLLGRSNPR